jgi:hypothetical protein
VRTDGPARIDVRVNNWNTKAAKSMEWRSFLGVVTAGTRLLQQHDDDDDNDDDGDGDDRLITKDAKFILFNMDCT